MQVAVADLAEELGADAVRAAAVLRFAREESIGARRLGRAPGVARLLDSTHAGAVSAAGRRLAPATGLKGLEGVFEEVLGRRRRRSHGTVYTPAFIVDYLCREGLAMAGARAPVVCDPFCGSGGFLVGAAAELRRRFGLAPARAYAEHLAGIDKDPEAVGQARLLCELHVLSTSRATPPALRLVEADSLLTSPRRLLESCGAPGGFGLVVTNPPYVKLQNLDGAQRIALAERFGGYAAGSFSLALLFLVAGRELLADGGCLAAITQNNLFTSLAGRSVRARLQEDGAVRRIVDFRHRRVFPDASAYTCLVFLGTGRAEGFQYAEVDTEITAGALDACEFAAIPHASLDAAKWRLARPPHLANLRRLESAGPQLGEVAAIRVGFATLKDSVFLVGAGAEVEDEATRPAVKVPALPGAAATRVIFPYALCEDRYRLIEEDVLRERFPRAYAYLEDRRALLEARDKGRGGYPWYAWGRTQGMDARGPKLLTRTFNRGPLFLTDPTDSLYCNGYGVFPRNGYPLDAIAAVLNSRVFHYYARLTSFQIDGGYECYQKNFIERFCLPDVPADALSGLDASPLEERLCEYYGISRGDLDLVKVREYAATPSSRTSVNSSVAVRPLPETSS